MRSLGPADENLLVNVFEIMLSVLPFGSGVLKPSATVQW